MVILVSFFFLGGVGQGCCTYLQIFEKEKHCLKILGEIMNETFFIGKAFL